MEALGAELIGAENHAAKPKKKKKKGGRRKRGGRGMSEAKTGELVCWRKIKRKF